ncbi:UPF0481 protein At3g47200-like [Lycium ferocissimum]|uniref:UPF0481 protein At3g47200-like n=1 Tax=Lycium ferocissimum TaxID=112874 RepID=UPI00281528D5|nr:UPF0481 protein At3g47200-like [Lycium ferocissimum]
MEKYKELLALEFADQDSKKTRPEGVLPWLPTDAVSIDKLYRRVKNIMPNVRECYADELIKDYSYEEFAQMMFLDGCFILQYLHCIVTGNYKELNMKSHDIAFIRHDLFVLENQLPFEVLQVLIFTCKNMILVVGFRCVYMPISYHSHRSAKELRKAGIYFRPGKSRHLSDVKFNSFHCSALLTLPPITVDDSTKSEFLNLVAYEACPDTPDDFGVTSYLCFMDSLIDHAEDVKELRSKGILLNYLGSDQEVADLFNEIARDLVPNPHAFVDVKRQIEDHYKSRTKIWIAEWKNTHFTTPWTLFAFIAALFVIGLQITDTFLAGVQTYYAVHPK